MLNERIQELKNQIADDEVSIVELKKSINENKLKIRKLITLQKKIEAVDSEEVIENMEVVENVEC